MKKRVLIAVVVVLALVGTASAVWAKPPGPSGPGSGNSKGTYDFVNIGDPASEVGHNLYGWGPVEPYTHGGHWGGVIGGTPPPCEDGNCRVISSGYTGEDGMFGVTNNSEDWASFTMDFGRGHRTKYLVLRALEGHAKDTFCVYIDSMGNEPVYYWAGDDSGSEYWVTHVIPVTLKGTHTIYLLSDQPHWSGWDTFGQVAFTWAKVTKVSP
jgi:hypothetical protein